MYRHLAARFAWAGSSSRELGVANFVIGKDLYAARSSLDVSGAGVLPLAARLGVAARNPAFYKLMPDSRCTTQMRRLSGVARFQPEGRL